MGPPASYSPASCRAADGLDTCPLPPKQARSENGECGPSTTGQGSAFQPSTEPSSGPLPLGGRPSGGKEVPRATGPVSLPEEGAERTKHSKTRWGAAARQGSHQPPGGYLTRASAFVFSPLSQEGNRKHPRSLQGSSHPSQEPSDSKVREAPGSRAPVGLGSGTGVPMPLAHTCPTLHVHTGLAKAEDRSRGCRAKKQEGPSPEDVRKKGPALASTVSKEGPAPVAHPAPGGGCCVAGPGRGLG